MQHVRFIQVAATGLALMTCALLATPSTSASGVRVVEGAVTFLGVSTTRTDEGLRVTQVVRGSAAEAAGIERGDVIVSFDGHSVDSSAELADAVRAREFGDVVDVTVRRDGERQYLTAELGRRDRGPRLELDGEYWIWSPHMRGRVEGSIGFDGRHGTALEDVYLCPADENCAFGKADVWYRGDCVGRGCSTYAVRFHDKPMLGVEIVQTTPELSRHLGGDRGGVLIGKVMEQSPAEEAGIEVGDLIVDVDGTPTPDRNALRRAIDAGAGGTIEIEVIRDGRARTLEAWIPEAGRSGPLR